MEQCGFRSHIDLDSRTCPTPAVQTWVSYLYSMSLGFLFCELWTNKIYFPGSREDLMG